MLFKWWNSKNYNLNLTLTKFSGFAEITLFGGVFLNSSIFGEGKQFYHFNFDCVIVVRDALLSQENASSRFFPCLIIAQWRVASVTSICGKQGKVRDDLSFVSIINSSIKSTNGWKKKMEMDLFSHLFESNLNIGIDIVRKVLFKYHF